MQQTPNRKSAKRLMLLVANTLTGAVIVSTPQDVGLRISMKTLRMFQQTRVPILGIVENMSYYICPHCNSRDYIFGQGGGSRAAEQLGIPFLGEVPLDLAIRTQSDLGKPIVIAQPEAASARPAGTQRQGAHATGGVPGHQAAGTVRLSVSSNHQDGGLSQ